MKRKKILLVAIFVFLVVLSSVACNKNNSNQTDSKVNSTQSTLDKKILDKTLIPQTNSSKSDVVLSELTNSVQSEKLTTKKLSNIEWIFFGNSAILEEKLGINIPQQFIEQMSKTDNKGWNDGNAVGKILIYPFKDISFTNDKKEDIVILLSFGLNASYFDEKNIAEQINQSANGIMIFSKDNGNYKPKMIKLIPEMRRTISYTLKDINSDKKDEILLSYKGGGNMQVIDILRIFMYIDGNIKEIFGQAIADTNYYYYSAENSYRFVPNTKDSNLLDIVFEINVLGPDEESYKKYALEEYNKQKNAGLLNPAKDVVTFTFDGKTYVPNKQLPKEYHTISGTW